MKVRELTPVLRKKAEEELNENAERIAAGVTELKEWLRTRPNMESLRPTDQWIIAFLRGAKFNLEKSKNKLEMYYNLSTLVPEYYENRDPFCPEIQEILKLGGFLPLRKLDSDDAPRVCLSRVGLLDPSKHKLVNYNKVAFMIIEILLLEDDNFTVIGQETLVDMTNMKLATLGQWTPALAKKTVMCFTKAVPLRIKGLHIMNTITGFEMAYAIFKIFLGQKIRNRFHVYGKGSKVLFHVASKKILPIEYGGDDGNLDDLRDYWKAKVESYRDWFMQKDGCSTEEIRRQETVQESDLIWTEKSFRTLDVD